MRTATELQQAIMELSETEYAQFRRWFDEYDSDEWDRQIKEDAKAGRLDGLAAEAWEAKQQGTLRDL